MGKKKKKILVGFIVAVLFCVSIALVIVGHRNVGFQGLLVQLVGLAGLIFLLWLYNRQYR